MTREALELSPPRRVLLIKPSALGDVVTALPVLRGLRRSFPEAHLAWLISDACAALVEADGDLDEVVHFPRRRLGRAWRSPKAALELRRFLRSLRRGGYDWVIDLQGLFRSGYFARATRAEVRAGFADAREGAGLCYTHPIAVDETHTVKRNIALARGLGIDARAEDMRLEVSPAGAEFAEQIGRSRSFERGEYVVCVPPTRWPTKRYPVRHWRKVARELRNDLPVVLLGAPEDVELCESIAEGLGEGVVNLAGRTNIPQMVGVIAACAGVVCCDSAAKFIAPAVGVDTVTLIGPTRVERTGPYGRGSAVVADVPCAGCLKRRCRHVSCMELIDPSDVVAAAREMLSERCSR